MPNEKTTKDMSYPIVKILFAWRQRKRVLLLLKVAVLNASKMIGLLVEGLQETIPKKGGFYTL